VKSREVHRITDRGGGKWKISLRKEIKVAKIVGGNKCKMVSSERTGLELLLQRL
jgi:hypothetical protein